MEGRTTRLALFVFVLASLCWLGGINIRALVGFDLLRIGTLDFKPNIHPFVERTIFSLLAQSSLVVNGAYIVAWLAGIVYLATTRFQCKKEGWLLMSAILFYLFTPVEVYTMVLDFQMWRLDMLGSNDLVEFRKLFIHRLGALSGLPLIALLCYYTIIGLVVFRPLRRKTEYPQPS